MKKSRLLVAVDSYLPRWDGIARTLSEILPHMTSQYEIRLIIPDYPGDRPLMDGVTFIPLPLIPWIRSGDVRFPIVLPWEIKRHVEWADILWTHTAVSIGGSCIRAAQRKDIPIVSMVHSVEWVVYAKAALISRRFTEWLWLKISKKRYGTAQRLLTPGSTTKDELIKNGFKNHIEVTPLGVSLRQFQPIPNADKASHRKSLGLPIDRPIIGYVGRFGPEKDLTTLLAAHAQIVQDTGAHLLLVGGTRDDLPEISHSDNITIVPPTMSPELYYQAMDIHVLASLTESFPLGILEAMACGVAPVTTAVGAVPTFIEEQKNGIIFPMENVDALAKALLDLLNSPAKRQEMANRARQTVEDGFTWEQAAQKISAHLDDVLESSNT